MIFTCGETTEAKEARLAKWHPYFLLFPRTIAIRDDKYVCVWLQWVERRKWYESSYAGGWWEVRFRLAGIGGDFST